MSDKVPEWAREAAAKIAAEAIELHTSQEIEGLSQEIAAALLSAYRRGVEDSVRGLKEARDLWNEKQDQGAFTHLGNTIDDAIRRLGEAE